MSNPHFGNSIFDDESHDGTSGSGPQGVGEPPRRSGTPVEYQPRRRSRRTDDDDGGGPLIPRRHRWVPIAIAAALVVGGGGVALKTLGAGLPSFSLGSEEQDYEGEGSGSATVTVRKGDTGADIGQRLVEEGVVKNATTFAAVFGADPEASKLQPGTYELRKQMSSASALTLMLDPKSRSQAGVTIPEGLWASEIYKKLSKATGEPLKDYKAVGPEDVGLPAGAKDKLEGYLFPSTYEFAEDATAEDQLKRMVTEFKNQVRPLDINADQLNKVVTIASIVQAESPGGEGDAKVARVILNRTDGSNGETAGRLQMDSTVHYALKKRGTITTSDKDRAVDSPYNTYTEQGLPPGPITNPGLTALKAAADPAEGDWLYFVTVNPKTGETKFAEDKAGHDANVKEFQAWCQDNPDGC